MLDLFSHREAEQYDEIHHEDRPENWNIKNSEKDVNKDKIVALTALSQNLNSGRRRIKV